MKPLAFGRAAKPEEIGWMAAFLASDLSAYTTGHQVGPRLNIVWKPLDGTTVHGSRQPSRAPSIHVSGG